MKIEKKQATLFILTLCALGFLIWQIFRLISDDLLAQDRATNAINQARNTVIAQKKAMLTQPTEPALPKMTPTENNNPYVSLVDQYQLLQMQHKLLSEQLAIAKLKAEIAKLNKEDATLSATPQTATYTQQKSLYQLVYLAQQDHRWTATVVNNNQYQTINTGDTLANGDKVILVNDQGAILQNSQQRIHLTFNGANITSLVSKKHNDPTAPSADNNTNNQVIKPVSANNKALPDLAEAEQSLYAGNLPSGAKVNADDKPYTLDEVLLLELPPSDYTIQLARDNRLNDLRKLVQQFHLDPRAMLFHFQQNQQMQHVLLLGSYKSKEEAAVAITKLPNELKLLTPQIISIDSVQQVIKAMR